MGYRRANTVADFITNIAAVRDRIGAAAARSGRDPAGVRLLPVSKTVDEQRIRLAIAAGCRELGENNAQEARRKAGNLADIPDLRWSVIGHLQRNKAKLVAAFADEFQALDDLRLAEALDRRLQAVGRGLDVFVQVNTSAEASKFGLAPADVAGFVKQLTPFASLRIKGLMTLAELTTDSDRVRACFVRLRTLRDRLRQNLPNGMSLDEVSMGMSGDYEIAVEEGATVVRVGQAIFGPRAVPDSHYWPEGDD